MKIAINGAGIAGPTLAYWLLRTGHEPTLIEKAPQFRTGGYVIDFWGVGYTIAERMEILPKVREAGYSVKEVRLVNNRGRKSGGFSTEVFRRITNDRITSLARGDLARVIYRSIEDRVETIFGNSISAIEQDDSGVRVSFERGAPRDFDLVIGADGLHSTVRELISDLRASSRSRWGTGLPPSRSRVIGRATSWSMSVTRQPDGRCAVLSPGRPDDVSLHLRQRANDQPGAAS